MIVDYQYLLKIMNYNIKDKKFEIIESCIRDTYLQVLLSFKTYELQADIYIRYNNIFQMVHLIVSSISSVGLASIVYTEGNIVQQIATVLSIASTIMIGINNYFGLDKKIKSQESATNFMRAIKERIITLLMELKVHPDSLEDITNRYKELKTKLDDFYINAPNTSARTQEKAKKSLHNSTSIVLSDIDIDNNLPIWLRKNINE